MTREHLFSVTAKDLDIEYFRNSKGAGGQKRDKTSSACRVRHRASGAVGQSKDHREQHKNKRLAFRRMAESPKFKMWITAQAMKLEPIDDIVDRLMDESNIQVEHRVDGKWVVSEQ